jgi:hypothetical protein
VVPQEQWDTIRGLYAGQNTGSVTDDRVAINCISELVLSGLCIVTIIHNSNIRTMDLPTAGQGPIAGKKLEKAATILQNVLRRIFIKPGKAERGLRHGANSSEASGEPVNETVLFEWCANECFNAV